MSDESIVDLVQKHQAQMGASAPTQMEGLEKTDSAAVQHKSAMMAGNMPEDRMSSDALDRLLANVKTKMAWVTIELPSQGLLYQNGEKVAEIRPFTFDDERVLKSGRAVSKPTETLERLLRNCVRGVEISELTPYDRLYLLFRIRGISYGDDYPIQHDCSNCARTSKLMLQISTLETKPLTEGHMRFMLPDSQQEAVIKLPRAQDEHLYSSAERLMENLYQFVYSIGGITDKTILEAFIQKTTVRDIDTLRRKIFTPEYGMEDHFFYTCNECGHKNRVNIGLNEDFFTAS